MFGKNKPNPTLVHAQKVAAGQSVLRKLIEKEKKMTVKIYGASDDLIEIEGDIREEFSYLEYDDTPAYLAFSDGTLLSIIYDHDGMWRINRVQEGSSDFSKREGTNVDSDYSDVVTLEGDISFVALSSAWRGVT